MKHQLENAPEMPGGKEFEIDPKEQERIFRNEVKRRLETFYQAEKSLKAEVEGLAPEKRGEIISELGENESRAQAAQDKFEERMVA